MRGERGRFLCCQARFNAVVPSIGLNGSRPDGFKYVIPKSLPSEFVWTIECKDVGFWCGEEERISLEAI